jgi:hypothetical protein
VEMQNDKLRTFFSRWLELSDKKKQGLTTNKCHIIMIVDGIDKIESEDNHSNEYKPKEESPEWFPLCFPPSFRVIVTCRPNSKAFKYYMTKKQSIKIVNMV